jgi:hypothetical protein
MTKGTATDTCFCAACGADLRNGLIPTESLYMYGNKATCDGCAGPRHYSRRIGLYDTERDRTAAWLCPDCGHREDR